jgi:hypothetical protein
MVNLYYSPEKFGLTQVGILAVPLSYEFSVLVVWQDEAGTIFWARDSGCSCPQPFEYVGVDDLNTLSEDTWDDFEDAVKEFNLWRDEDDYLAADKTELLAKISRLLRPKLTRLLTEPTVLDSNYISWRA